MKIKDTVPEDSEKRRWEWDDLPEEMREVIVEENGRLNRTRHKPGCDSVMRIPIGGFTPIMPVGTYDEQVRMKIAVFNKVREVNGLGRYIFSHVEATLL